MYLPAARPVYADAFHSFSLARFHISTVSPSTACNTAKLPIDYITVCQDSCLQSAHSLSSVGLLPLNQISYNFFLNSLMLPVTQSWKKKNQICNIVVLQTFLYFTPTGVSTKTPVKGYGATRCADREWRHTIKSNCCSRLFQTGCMCSNRSQII